MDEIESHRCFGGRQLRFRHRSEVLDCDMVFALYLPPQADHRPVPLLHWLSGLTCSDENFVTKAGAQRYAAEHGIAILVPDTSPRGDQVPDDPDGAWDLGHGAGFYVNATREPWRRHYRMHDYVSRELPALVTSCFPLRADRQSISGHSMGGHGALTIALRRPGSFRSVSAFAPICAPTRCPWGEKAFTHYLGEDPAAWHEYDAALLIGEAGERLPLLIEQGDADPFLETQLRPELLDNAARAAGYPLQLRMQPGYDHSYFFIASFIGEHIAFHAEHLYGGDGVRS